MRTVRTVLGDIDAAELGVCDSHDHLFFRSERLPGQQLDDPAATTAELKLFADQAAGRSRSGRRSVSGAGWSRAALPAAGAPATGRA